jgi:DNA-binding XRE family transcriptional regulator
MLTPTELQSWRKEAGLTQTGLAALLGVDTMTVSRWERGERAIPPFLRLALRGIEAKIVDMSSKHWFPGTEPQMGMDGSWYQISGPCADCGHPILFHRLAPWHCQNADCPCPPTSRRRQKA